MVRRTRKQRGGLWGDLAQRAASAYVNKVALPVTKYAVNQAVNRSGLANTPEVQAAQAMFRDAKAAYQSPQGQALMGQFLQAARSPQAQALMTQARQAATSPQAQAVAAGLFAAAAPQLANPYGRSAGPVAAAPQPTWSTRDAEHIFPMQAAKMMPLPQQTLPPSPPMGQTAPMPAVAATMGQPAVAAAPLDGAGEALVSALLWNEADPRYREKLAKEAGRLAKSVKKSTAWNQMISDNLRALGTEMTRVVKDQGVQPGPTPFRSLSEPAPTAVVETITRLSDAGFRTAVATRVAQSARPAGDQKFLPGTVNQLAAAVGNEIQRVAFGGRKTRRGRKVRRSTRRT